MQVATLIFLAEWGDRSMLATIVLAVSQSPAGELCEPLIDLACVDPRLCASSLANPAQDSYGPMLNTSMRLTRCI